MEDYYLDKFDEWLEALLSEHSDGKATLQEVQQVLAKAHKKLADQFYGKGKSV